MTRRESLLWTIWAIFISFSVQVAYDIYQKTDIYKFFTSFYGAETWGLLPAGLVALIIALLVQREINKEVKKNKKSSP